MITALTQVIERMQLERKWRETRGEERSVQARCRGHRRDSAHEKADQKMQKQAALTHGCGSLAPAWPRIALKRSCVVPT